MALAKRLLKKVLRPAFHRQAAQRIASLRSIQSPQAAKLADALSETLDRRMPTEERNWSNRIENLREQLLRETRTVEITDYGAGDATDRRSTEEMLSGVKKTATVSGACGYSKPYFWSLLLFKLVRKLQPETAIELGTCLGISAAYQAAAQTLNGHGRVITMEGAPALAELAKANWQSLGLNNVSVVTGRFVDTLDGTLTSNAPIDYAFIDGHHDEHATLEYFDRFRPHLSDNAIVVFDDIAWSPGMCRAWEKLRQDRDIALSIDLRVLGICVVQRGAREKQSIVIRMPV